MKMGRPSVYNDAMAMEICTRMAEGEGLRKICRDAHMPERITIFRWLLDGKHAEFCYQYGLAREAQADHYAEENVEISDETTVEVRYQGEKVVLDISSAAVSRNKLRVDARKWYASKLAPKKYGDKTTTELTGPDGGAMQTKITVEYVAPK